MMTAMSSRPIVIDVVDDIADEPRIRFKAGNGRILTASEAYQGGADKALDTVELIIDKIRRGEYIVKRNGVPVD